jgi:hypothetical protein
MLAAVSFSWCEEEAVGEGVATAGDPGDAEAEAAVVIVVIGLIALVGVLLEREVGIKLELRVLGLGAEGKVGPVRDRGRGVSSQRRVGRDRWRTARGHSSGMATARDAPARWDQVGWAWWCARRRGAGSGDAEAVLGWLALARAEGGHGRRPAGRGHSSG